MELVVCSTRFQKFIDVHYCFFVQFQNLNIQFGMFQSSVFSLKTDLEDSNLSSWYCFLTLSKFLVDFLQLFFSIVFKMMYKEIWSLVLVIYLYLGSNLIVSLVLIKQWLDCYVCFFFSFQLFLALWSKQVRIIYVPIITLPRCPPRKLSFFLVNNFLVFSWERINLERKWEYLKESGQAALAGHIFVLCH